MKPGRFLPFRVHWEKENPGGREQRKDFL